MSQKKTGVILSYITQVFGILSGMIYTPIMLRLLGQAEYGLYTLANSTVSMLSLLNLGFSGCYLYFYNKALNSDDKDEAKRFNGMFLCIFLTISMLCLICGSFLVRNLDLFFGNGLTAEEYAKGRILVIVMIVNMAVNFPISVFSGNIDAKERFIFINGYGLVSNIMALGINIAVLILGMGSVGLAAVALTLSMAKFAIYGFYAFNKLKMSFIFTGFKFNTLKILFSYTFFIFLNQLINQINGQLDKILLGRFCGTSVVAVYGIGCAINCYYQQFGGTVASVFGPEINRIATQRDKSEAESNRELTNIFIKVSRVQIILLMLVLSGFVVFGKKFVYLWAGPGYDEAFYIAVGLMIAGSMSYFQSVGLSIQRAKFRHQDRAVVYFLMSIANIIISIPLLLRFGALGAAIGTMIVWIIGDVFYMNWYYYKVMNLEMKRYWTEVYKLFIPMLGMLLVGKIIALISPPLNYVSLLIDIGIYSCIYFIVMWFLAFNREEKGIILGGLAKLRRKRKWK